MVKEYMVNSDAKSVLLLQVNEWQEATDTEGLQDD